MRFKVKLPASSKFLFVTDTDPQPTVGSLKRATADAFETLGISGTAFEISLNGKDLIEGSDNTLLSDVGIVSGDIIRIIVNDEFKDKFVEAGNINDLDSSSSSGENMLSSTDGHDHDSSFPSRAIPNDVTPYSYSPPKTVDGGIPVCLSEVNKCLMEPILCRESTSTQIPDALRRCYRTSSVHSEHDALVVVLHAMMLESGYENEVSSILSTETKVGNVYRLRYRHNSCPEVHIGLTCVPMGTLVTINGTYKTTTFHLNLKSSSYVYDGPLDVENPAIIYNNLPKLSHLFKDAVVYPLLTALQSGEGVPPSCGIGSLSMEVKLIILNFLNAPALLNLSECCKEFYELTNKQSIWKRLCFADFAESLSEKFIEEQTITWKEKYQVMYKKKKLKNTAVPFFLGPPPFTVPLPGIFPFLDPGARILTPHGIVGGEFDRIPGIPVPLRPDLGLPPFLPPPPGPRMFTDNPRFPFFNRPNGPRWPGYYHGC